MKAQLDPTKQQQFNVSFNNFKHAERQSNDPLNSSDRKRRYYRQQRSRSRGSLERYDKYRYNVNINTSNQSIKDSIGRNRTEFSPFQPRLTPDFEMGKENLDRNGGSKKEDGQMSQMSQQQREETTTFSPYEDRFRPYRDYDGRGKQAVGVLPFHFNEQRKLADSLKNVRDRISKQISFKQYPIAPRQFSPVLQLPPPPRPCLPLPLPLPISPPPISHPSPHLIQQLTASNQYLSQQVTQYKQIVSRLQTQLRTRDSKVLLANENVERRVLEERMSSEKVIGEMRNQIRLLLEKNQILGRRLKEREERDRQSMGVVPSAPNIYHRKKSQTVCEGAGVRQNRMEGTLKVHEENEGNRQLVEELTHLINKEYFQKVIKDKNPGKIKYASRQLKPIITQILKRNVKLESFANCVIDMRTKITDFKENDLKKCWKWLKALVQQAYRVKRLYQGDIRLKLGLKQGISSEQICQAVLRRI